MKKSIKLCLLLLLLFGTSFAAYKMYTTAAEYRTGRESYEKVQEAVIHTPVPAQTSPPTATTPPVTEETSEALPETAPDVPAIDFPQIDFPLLKTQNSDTVGWLYIEGTNVNYPVVQGTDNRHYVTTMFDGQINTLGSVFMDFRNDPGMSDVHTILYGHNMRDKSMFGDIVKYRDQDFYEEHPTGLYITPEANYSFDIVAAYVATLAEPAWQLEFVGDEDILTWIDGFMEKSDIESHVDPQIDDRFITLSTCTYDFFDARFLLVGVLNDCGPPQAQTE